MTNQELLENLIYKKCDYSPKSTVQSLEDFLESSIYRDFLEELSVRIEDMKQSYEMGDSKKYLETRGALAAMRLMAGIFVDLYENAKSDSMLEKKDGK
jgi:hypothetical protein